MIAQADLQFGRGVEARRRKTRMLLLGGPRAPLRAQDLRASPTSWARHQPTAREPRDLPFDDRELAVRRLLRSVEEGATTLDQFSETELTRLRPLHRRHQMG